MSERKGAWMQTLSGRKFFPLDPRPEEVFIEDIAGSLSKMCRFGGHCLRFESVAEHCVHMATAAPAPLQLTALLHDAAEAYLVDVPRPVKRFLTGYAEIEDGVMTSIATRFGLFYPFPDVIKTLDNAILVDEVEQNMAHPPEVWDVKEPRLGAKLCFWSPADAFQEFVTAFFRYGGRV